MSSVFFQGRTWVTPSVMSVVDDSKMYGVSASAGNRLALIGTASGGEPNTPLKFGSFSEARRVLRGGELLDAVNLAFGASSQSDGPSSVTVIRLNPAVQSGVMLKDASAADCIALASTNYGIADNAIKVKIEQGSTAGFKVTTQLGSISRVADNLERRVIDVQYTGTGVGLLSIAESAVTLTLNSVVTSIDLSVYQTVQQLVDRLNAVGSVTASVLDGNGTKLTKAGLDGVTDLDIKTAKVTLVANLQVIVDWINSAAEDFVTATRAPGAMATPALVGFTHLTGGDEGIVTTAQWADALEKLQEINVQWVVPLISHGVIHAMVSSHCSYMSTIGRMERRAICGTSLGMTDAIAISTARDINSDRVSLTHLGIYAYDLSGVLRLFEPYYAAVMIAAAFAGLNPGTPMTNKSLRIAGVERRLRNPTDTDDLVLGGVLCIESTLTGYKVVKSISTWLNDANYNRKEVSVGVAVDYMMRRIRDALDEYRGAKNNPLTMASAVSRVDSILRELATPEPAGIGLLAGNKASPPYKNIVATQYGDVMKIEFEASPVLPLNYIPITCYASAYSGISS